MTVKLKVEVKKSIRIVTHFTFPSGTESKNSSRPYTNSHHAAAAYAIAYCNRPLKHRPRTSDDFELLKLKVYNRVRPIFKKILDEK
jgi:putative IMPACT (imprinted ancient) family translation regulator